jgi:transglutaminase-like putative cysteine protease
MAERAPPEPIGRTTRRWVLVAAGACALPMLAQVPPMLAAALVATWVLAWFSEKPWPAGWRLVLTLLLGGLVLVAYDLRIGRDTSCAGLLAMLMLKPFETHSRRDAQSLLGFSLFAPFAAFLQDQGPLTLSLALPAVVLSLVAWSRLAQGDPARGPSTRLLPELRQVGVAMLLAVPLALAGFWLFPRLPSPLWGLPENSVGRAGLGDRMTPNEWLDELVDDAPALRARFLGPTPPRDQMYWRGPVLMHFDGEAWTRDLGAGGVPTPGILPLRDTIRYEVMLEPTERRDLLVLDLPLSAPDGSALNAELTATREAPINNLVRYVGASAPQARYLEPLRPWQRRVALSLPQGRDPRTVALAREWAAANPDPMALTERFLGLLRREFKYTISAPPVGFHATDEFLFETKLGFCQHFSSAYAVFMRAAGVPTRVVTGYVGGHYNRIGGYWLLKHKDAHAWTEIWVDGRGWLRVDPTAAIAPENILDTLDDLQARQRAGIAGAADGVLGPVIDGSDFLRRQWNQMVLGFDALRQEGLLRPFGVDRADPWQLVLAFGVGSGLALLLTLWVLLRQHRDTRHPLVRAWHRFTRRLGKAGFAKRREEPPLAYARRLSALLPAQAAELMALSQRYSDWRYAPGMLTDEQQATLARQLRSFLVTTRSRPA